MEDMITDIRAGKRPPRPIDASQSRLLQDPVWNVITTGWRDQIKQRCKLSFMYRIFSSPSQERQLGKIILRVASFFQFLQNSESEIMKQVNEMNEVTPPTLPLPKAYMTHSISRTPRCRIGSD